MSFKWILLAVIALAFISWAAIYAFPRSSSNEVKQVKANIVAQYGKVKFTNIDQYQVTAEQQALLYWEAEAILSTEDADRYILEPSRTVGEVVEVQFSHSGNHYQFFQFYEKGKKKFNYLREVEK